jgi:pimeloyl-ACP methyl ester carboxylesterase
MDMALTQAEKRPIGRSQTTSAGLVLLRSVVQASNRVWPELAAELARRAFFQPIRAQVRPEERTVLATGNRFEIKVGTRRVVAWSWGAGPAVLLSHGWGGHAGQMTALVEPLVAAGMQAIAVDLPAHGLSEGKRSNLVEFGRAYRALSDLFGGFSGAVAHSFGAGAMLYASAHGLGLPRAVLFAPAADFEPFWTRFRHMLHLSPELWTRMQRRAETNLGVSFEEVLPRSYAHKLDLELLIFHDEADAEVPLAWGEALAAVCRNATLVRTFGLGHRRILKDPGLATRAAEFLARPAHAGERERGARRSVVGAEPVLAGRMAPP